MIRCIMCGAPMDPWYEVCMDCCRLTETIPQSIIANKSMKEMKTDV